MFSPLTSSSLPLNVQLPELSAVTVRLTELLLSVMVTVTLLPDSAPEPTISTSLSSVAFTSPSTSIGVVMLGALTLVSIVTERPEPSAVLPAVSVVRAVIVCVPADKADVVTVQVPKVAVPVPTVPSMLEINVIAPPLGPEPVNVAVVSLVILSVLDVPVSLLASRSGVPGAEGAVVSIVTLKLLDAALSLLLASVAFAEIAWVTPAVNALVVICQLPSVAVPVPITVVPPPSWSL